MRMIETTTNSEGATIAFEQMLQAVFPAEGLLRLVGANGGDAFFRRRGGGSWAALCQERDAKLDDSIASHGAADVFFSPVSWAAPVHPSPLAACACLWASLKLGLLTQQRHEPRPR